jgi:hypothetical protein
MKDQPTSTTSWQEVALQSYTLYQFDKLLLVKLKAGKTENHAVLSKFLPTASEIGFSWIILI